MHHTIRSAAPALLAFAGVLLAGALTAPAGHSSVGHGSVGHGSAGTTATAQTTTAEQRATAPRRRLVGRSVQGRPIWAYRKGNPRAERVVLVLGQMHGDERAGVTAARHIIRNVPVSRRADVWIIPTMNPDGLASDTRNNARGVDLNRNWPTGWEQTSTSGSGPASEPETRAMRRFLQQVQPTFITSLHQPFGVIGRSDKNMRYVRRLSTQLDLPIARVQVGDCEGRECPPGPTLTSWYNTRQPGYCVTVELKRRHSRAYLTTKAGPGILRATFAH